MSEKNISGRQSTSNTNLLSRQWWKELEGINNQGILFGKIQSEFQYSHKFCDCKYYKSRIVIQRRSEAVDVIPLIISETLLESIKGEVDGKYVRATGQIYTYDLSNEKDRHITKHYLRICFLANTLSEIEEYQDFNNSIYIRGKICQEPYIKTKASGMKVAELMVAVIRKDGRRDHIPCVAWQSNADNIERELKNGDEVELLGRFQSRKYFKKDHKNPEEFETRTAYEVAIAKIL